MKVNSISSTNGINFMASIKIKGKENQGHKYLYNEVNQLTKDFCIPANFRTHEIELPSVNVDIMKELNKLKIKFSSGRKHQKQIIEYSQG